MRHLVLGLGEVGTAIQKVINADGYDPRLPKITHDGEYDVLHVCFPFSATFETEVAEYRKHLKASLVIVHSTVPIGTCERIDAVHSPIRGVHPNLEAGIRTFVKFFGGPRAEEAAQYFSAVGVKTLCTPLAKNTEAMKLWDTEQYREAIKLEKRIHERCDIEGLDFDIVYTLANATYNEGYELLGMPAYKKYVLKHVEGPIGGHCLEPNHKLLWKLQ